MVKELPVPFLGGATCRGKAFPTRPGRWLSQKTQTQPFELQECPHKPKDWKKLSLGEYLNLESPHMDRLSLQSYCRGPSSPCLTGSNRQKGKHCFEIGEIWKLNTTVNIVNWGRHWWTIKERFKKKLLAKAFIVCQLCSFVHQLMSWLKVVAENLKFFKWHFLICPALEHHWNITGTSLEHQLRNENLAVILRNKPSALFPFNLKYSIYVDWGTTVTRFFTFPTFPPPNYTINIVCSP